jgi:hypothetical protein
MEPCENVASLGATVNAGYRKGLRRVPHYAIGSVYEAILIRHTGEHLT